MPIDAVVLSCEHATNRVPAAYKRWFASPRAKRALAGHRGYDVGALAVAQALARRFQGPLYIGAVTRLLVDLNRSPGHPHKWSEFSAGATHDQRTAVAAAYYAPHRDRVTDAIRALIRRRQKVLHLSVHSFVPRLAGHTRTADVALLYDPARDGERRLANAWKAQLKAADRSVRVRRNYPYRGTADGFTTYLRRVWGARVYLGIELELNQAALATRSAQARMARLVGDTLQRCMAGPTGIETGERLSGSPR